MKRVLDGLGLGAVELVEGEAEPQGVGVTRIAGQPLRVRVVDFDISFDRIFAIAFKTSVAVVLVSVVWSLIGFVAFAAVAAVGLSMRIPGQ